jgi:hypothetical protein
MLKNDILGVRFLTSAALERAVAKSIILNHMPVYL